MSEYAIELCGIKKAFNGVPVLEGFDFKVKKGEVHALVGGNGAGKSVAMKILTGIYKSDGGSIKIDGDPVTIGSMKDSESLGIRMIFQELSLIPTLTVMENIFLNHEHRKNGLFLNQKKMREQALELIKNLEIDVNIDTPVENLEVGYCQLVEIAKALSVNAKIIVMDEPTASLSESETAMLFRIISVLKEKGVSVVYISHRMKEIFQIADSITVLRNGQFVISGETSKFTLDSLISHMMGKTTKNTFIWEDRDTPRSEEVLMQVENLSDGSILKNVSFSVKKGEVLGIAGLMGSGRTEILESLFGIRRPASGKVSINGKLVVIKNIRDAIKNKIALVPEDRRRQGLVLIHSVKNNIILSSLASYVKGGFISNRKIIKTANKYVEDLIIKTSSIDKVIQLLSGGNQQKVVISKWLNTDPDILLLDEPTAGVDVNAKGEIISIIRRFSEGGKSAILVTSELSELLAVCDRILVLRNGVITKTFFRSEIESEEVLQHAIQQ